MTIPHASECCDRILTREQGLITLPRGVTTITLTVSDGLPNGTSTSTVTITAVDQTPPVLSSSVALPLLWPPDHTMVNVGLTATAVDNCDGSRPVSVRALSNESETDPTGDGNFSPDASGIATETLRLRAERKGTGNGRVYLIAVTATDFAGNVGMSCQSVVVPLAHQPASLSSVEGLAASAVAFCKASSSNNMGYFVIGNGPIIGPLQ